MFLLKKHQQYTFYCSIDAKVMVGCAKSWDKMEYFVFPSKYTTQMVP